MRSARGTAGVSPAVVAASRAATLGGREDARARRPRDSRRDAGGPVFFVLLLVLLAGCRTGRPSGEPVAALTASSSEEAAAQLREQRAEFRGMRSLMRVRATTNGETRSFRAQLAVHDARRMELTAYTPVGTTALKMTADGDRITTDPEVAPSAFAFLRTAGLTPAETGMLLLGLPPRDDVQVEVAPQGLVSASAGGISVVYDPPAFPAQKVVVTRGSDRIEITHEEVVREN